MGAEARYRISAEDRSKAALDSFRKNMLGIDSAMGGVKAKIATLISGVAIGALIKSAADAGDEVWNLHVRLGATTESLSQLRHVAGLSGVSFETVAKSVQILSRNTGDAARGLGGASEAFKALNIDVGAFVQLKPEEQLEALADELMGIQNESQRVAFAMATMGRSGAEMLQIMSEGSAGIRAMREEADALGLTLSTKDAKALADAGDAIDRLKSASTALGTSLALLAAGPVETMAAVVVRAVGGFREWIDELTSSTIDKAIEKMEELGNSVEDINRMTAIRDLAENQKDLARDSIDAKTALAAVATAAGVFHGRVVAVGDVLTSGVHKVARYGTSYNDLSAQMNQTTKIVDNDVVRSIKEGTRQWDQHQRSLSATAALFEDVDVAIEPLWEEMRKLAAVGDPFDTANLAQAKGLLEQLDEAQREVNLSFLKGEVSADVWTQLTEKLDLYRTSLGGYAGILEQIIELEQQRKDLMDQAQTGKTPPAAAPGGPEIPPPAITVGSASSIAGGHETPGGVGDALTTFQKIEEPDFLDDLPGKLQLASDGFWMMANNADLLGQALISLDELGVGAVENLVSASVEALRGNKNAWQQFEQVMKQAVAGELQALASSAAVKAIYEMAQGLAAVATGNPGAGAHFAAAGKYALVAGVGIVASAALLGSASSGSGDGGGYDEGGSSYRPSGRSAGGGSTSTALASSPTTIHVTHVYYGNVYYGSQSRSDAASIQEQLDAGTLFIEEGVA